MNISFDFDNTLQNPKLQELAKELSHQNTIFIISSRFEKFDNSDLFKLASELDITNIALTNGKSKADAIVKNDIQIHFEDCPFEVQELRLSGIHVVQVEPFIVDET